MCDRDGHKFYAQSRVNSFKKSSDILAQIIKNYELKIEN